ncbi:hypothetical protein B0H10DRAFT_2120020 [Mycena sp. CBHHK59/15]|nr:hypothetical protein B0H10DRAFT_2120020 [Mycena sp. CBHHK59/15]
MRSLVMSLFMFTSAISTVLGEGFLWLSVDPMLVWNYTVMAALAGAGGCAFWLSVRRLNAQEDALNSLSAGHVGKVVDTLDLEE